MYDGQMRTYKLYSFAALLVQLYALEIPFELSLEDHAMSEIISFLV
jgi:hypothetical protein